MNKFITFLLFLITFGYGSKSFAQENVEPEDIAVDENTYENDFYDALTHKAIENYDRAIVSLQKCLEKDNKNAVIYHELGKNYLALKQYADAENSFNKAVELNPNQRWYWNGLYDIYYELKDYNKSIPIVQKLIEFDKNMQDDLVSLYMYTNQKDKALALLLEMEAASNLSKLMEQYKLQLQQTPEANKSQKSDLEDAIKKNPKVEQYYIDLIYQYSESGNEEKAFDVAKKLADEIPTSDWAHVSLIKFHLNNKDGENAKISLFKILESNKIDLKIKHRAFNEFLIFATNTISYYPDLEKAIVYLEEDKNVNVPKEVAKYFLKKNKTDEAIVYFEKSIAKQPEDFESFEFLMQLLVEKNQFEKINTLTSKQLELYPTQASLYYYAGLALNNLSKHKEAKLKLEEGIDYVVENKDLETNFYKQLVISCEKLGDSKSKDKYQLKLKK